VTTNTWTWTGPADEVRVRVIVGAHAMYVERIDGEILTADQHRQALVNALGDAAAEILSWRAAVEASK
jgi:hypothetical protein